MARYSVKLSRQARKFLEKAGMQDQRRLAASLRELAVEPRDRAKKLKGSEYFRKRVGRFRIMYAIKDQSLLVLVVTIDDRKQVYRKLKR
jgi:mRNA interferase RelE/StbE